MTEQLDDEKMFNEVTDFISIIKQEQLSPPLLPFNHKLFDSIQSEIIEQENKMKEFFEGTQTEPSQLSGKNFKFLMYNAQKEKITYLLKLYLRIRLLKIQKYCFDLSKNPSLVDKVLSDKERHFLKNYAKIKYNYFTENVMSLLPKHYRGLAGLEVIFDGKKQERRLVESKQSKMEVVEPDMEAFVFTKIGFNPDEKRYNLQIKASNVPQKQFEVVSGGDIIFGPYRQVKDFIESGNGCLL